MFSLPVIESLPRVLLFLLPCMTLRHLFVALLSRTFIPALWGPEGAKRMISRTPNAVLGKKPALARARQEEASVTDFHASMDVRLDAHSDRPDRVGHRESQCTTVPF